jgi:hypothetical protein
VNKNKKLKIDEVKGAFNSKCEEAYFRVEQGGKPQCLLFLQVT